MHIRLCIGLSFCVLLFACSGDGNNTEEVEERSSVIELLEIELNPTGYAPLSAVLSIESTQSVSIAVKVLGKHGQASDIVYQTSEQNTDFELDVLGLYADYNNQIEISVIDSSGLQIEATSLDLQTDTINPNLPNIQIDTASNVTSPEFHFVNYFGFIQSFTPQRPFIFDQFGDIRWYLDFAEHPTFSNLFYDNGMTRLQNGNLIFGNGSTGSLYEIDMHGRIINSWGLQGNGFHHHVIEKPNGNFLVTIDDASKTTIEDVVVEVNRITGEFVNTWDLNESLDNTRRAWPTERADLNIDWFHANGVEYSETDNAVIVSGRTQGIVKLNAQNEVSYILAPHRDWQISGQGSTLSQYLLTPLDADDEPITEADILSGVVNHPDFEWAWYQHSPILLPNGNLMVFDNGENRNYSDAPRYSRAVEYQIDESEKTIKQVWSYGKERGEETYSPIVSKVSYIPNKNAILFTPGAARDGDMPRGKVIEVDYLSKEVLFEASIIPPNTVANISFHNVLRVSLYPE